MAHHIYQTEGIVLGGFNFGESNRFLYILTKDMGLISASAQGVRELKSKLRFSLQDFSYSKIDLVRGREIWRITNAKNIHTVLSHSCVAKRKSFRNLILLTKRLFIGEVPHKDLFDDIISGFEFLRAGTFTKEELHNFEIIMSLKILDNLGYLIHKSKYKVFIEMDNWDVNIIKNIQTFSIEAVHDINSALKETQM